MTPLPVVLLMHDFHTDDEIAGLKSRLQEMVAAGAGEGEILAAMDVLKTKFADYGRDRTSAAVYHLDELQARLYTTSKYMLKCICALFVFVNV
jgi:hypothetical protein